MADGIGYSYDDLLLLVKSLEKDVTKFDGGNAVAGKRVRAGMADVIKRAKSIRTTVQEIKHERKAETK